MEEPRMSACFSMNSCGEEQVAGDGRKTVTTMYAMGELK